MSKSVVVYSRLGCRNCVFTKKQLTSQGVMFIEKKVDEHPELREEIAAYPYDYLPVVIAEGHEVFWGLQPDKVAEILP